MRQDKTMQLLDEIISGGLWFWRKHEGRHILVDGRGKYLGIYAEGALPLPPVAELFEVLPPRTLLGLLAKETQATDAHATLQEALALLDTLQAYACRQELAPNFRQNLKTLLRRIELADNLLAQGPGES